jgi:hypothetical protein
VEQCKSHQRPLGSIAGLANAFRGPRRERPAKGLILTRIMVLVGAVYVSAIPLCYIVLYYSTRAVHFASSSVLFPSQTTSFQAWNNLRGIVSVSCSCSSNILQRRTYFFGVLARLTEQWSKAVYSIYMRSGLAIHCRCL